MCGWAQLEATASQLLPPLHLVVTRAHAIVVRAAQLQLSSTASSAPSVHDPALSSSTSEVTGTEGSGSQRRRLQRQLMLLLCPTALVSEDRDEVNEEDEIEQDLTVELALAALRSCVAVRRAQDVYLSSKHHEVAGSWADLESLLSFLLCRAPSRLHGAFPEQFGTFAAASRAEHHARQRGAAIRQLYEHTEAPHGLPG